jgi:hypothetical protein
MVKTPDVPLGGTDPVIDSGLCWTLKVALADCGSEAPLTVAVAFTVKDVVPVGVVVEPVTVIVVVPEPVTVAGLKLATAPGGRLEALKLVVELNPF